jgi:hypothetical protein
MSDGTLAARHRLSVAGAEPSSDQSRLATILHVQWALAIACSYLVLFGRESGDPNGFGPIVVAGFLAVNLVVGRLPLAIVQRPLFGGALAVIDTLLVVASLYVAGQLSVELMLLCVGILMMAIAGMHTGPIAVATLALTTVYLGVVWYTGGTTLWRSSVLLRVPLLFTASMVYAWLVELGSRGATQRIGTIAHPNLLDTLEAQRLAIERCGAALSAGVLHEAEAALKDVASHNEAMRRRGEA